MKKILTMLLTAAVAAGAVQAMTLAEGYAEIAALPSPDGEQPVIDVNVTDGWLDALPLDDAVISYASHPAGRRGYYNSRVEEVARLLPADRILLSATDARNLVYIFGTPAEGSDYEVLILVDRIALGDIYAVHGKISAHIASALKAGHIEFTPDNRILVTVPLLDFR